MKRTILVLTLTLFLFTSKVNAAANNEIGDLDIKADNTVITGTATNTALIVRVLVAAVY